MFPSIAAPTRLPLSHDQNSSFSFYHPPVPNHDQTNEFSFEDIWDNYQSLINQPSYQDSTTPLDFAAHLSRSNEQHPVLQTRYYDQDYCCLDSTAYLRSNEQNLHFQETITADRRSESSNNVNSINISFSPQPNNYHIDEVMRERVHAGSKLALRMRTNLEVVDDGFKWRKYGKKKVKTSPYPSIDPYASYSVFNAYELNYFKCSTIGCNVKKRIERDRDDSSYVITTYDGVHHHQSSS